MKGMYSRIVEYFTEKFGSFYLGNYDKNNIKEEEDRLPETVQNGELENRIVGCKGFMENKLIIEVPYPFGNREEGLPICSKKYPLKSKGFLN